MGRRNPHCLTAAALLLLVCCLAAEVDAASALGRAGATVLAPAAVGISSVKIVVAAPGIVAPVRSSAPSLATLSASAAAMSGEDAAVATIAGLTVSSVNGGSALSFSVAGDTTSAFVVQLAPAGPAAPASSAAPASTGSTGGPASASPSASSGGAGESRPGAGAASPPGLILATQPLNGGGRLSIVLTQAPSDLVPNAVSLSVNYN